MPFKRELFQLHLDILEVEKKLSEPSPGPLDENQAANALDLKRAQARQKLERIRGSLKESIDGLQHAPLDRLAVALENVARDLESIPDACKELRRIAAELKKYSS